MFSRQLGLVCLHRRAVLAGALSSALVGRAAAQSRINIQAVDESARGTSPYEVFSSIGPFQSSRPPIDIRRPECRGVAYFPDKHPPLGGIVFSHDMLASPDIYDPLLRHWASHGFVVLAPIHTDSMTNTTNTTRTVTTSTWQERTLQVRRAIEFLPALMQQTGYQGARSRPFVCGHGVGALSAQVILGCSPDGSVDQALQDEQPFAGIAISPPVIGSYGLKDASWRKLAAPMLYAAGNDDLDSTGNAIVQQERDILGLLPPGHKHLAVLKHGGAATFGGQDQSNADIARCFKAWKAVSAAYLTAYATLDVAILRDLASNYYQTATSGLVEMSYS